MPLGIAFVKWTGFGIVGTTILGIDLFDESISLAEFGHIAIIVIGIAGLKLSA